MVCVLRAMALVTVRAVLARAEDFDSEGTCESPDTCTWRRLSTKPRAWVYPRLVEENLTQQILYMLKSNIEDEGSPFPIHHSIVEQGHPAVHAFRQAVSARVRLPVSHFEPVFVLEYRPGMRCDMAQSMPHFDWNCLGGSPDEAYDDPEPCSHLRIVTSVLYLNSVEPSIGGSTVFPLADFSHAATEGAALAWFNVNEAGRKEPLAQHHGQCLRSADDSERKFVAVQYVRASPFDYDDEMVYCDEDPDSCRAVESLRQLLS